MCDAHVDTVIPVGIKCVRVEGANTHVTFELQVTLFTLVLWSFFLFADNIFWKSLLSIYKKHLKIRLLYADGPGHTRRGIFFQIHIQINNEPLRPFVQASTDGIEISPMVYFSNQIQPKWFQPFVVYITPYLNIACNWARTYIYHMKQPYYYHNVIQCIINMPVSFRLVTTRPGRQHGTRHTIYTTTTGISKLNHTGSELPTGFNGWGVIDIMTSPECSPIVKVYRFCNCRVYYPLWSPRHGQTSF